VTVDKAKQKKDSAEEAVQARGMRVHQPACSACMILACPARN
jgi:hypothetical protein